MKDVDKDKDREQLIGELGQLRQRIAKLQAKEAEQKKAEEALQASEAKYKALVENAHEIIVVVQDDMSKFSNPRAAEITGYSQEELTSRPFLEFVHPDDRQIVMENYPRRLKGDTSTPVAPVRILDKNGKVRWIEFSWSAFTWERRPALLYFVSDVTEWKKMEEALRQSEARYRELADGITDVFYAVDKKLRCTYWNKASEEITGIAAENALGKYIFDIFPDTEATRKAMNVYRMVVATQEPQHYINKHSIRGRDYIFDISAYPTAGGLCVYVKDITERRKLEKALEESEQWYRYLFDNAPFGIGFTSIDGKVININKTMETIAGYSAEEFTKMNVADTYVNEADREVLLQEVKRRGFVIDYPVQLRRKDGTFYDALVSVRLTTIGDREFLQTILHDVTDRKRAEDALRESEERYRALVELSPEAIFVASEGKHVFVNSAGMKLFGASSPDQIIGKSVMDVIHPDYRAVAAERMRKSMETGIDAPAIEERFLRLDGVAIDVEVRAAPLVYQGKPAIQAVVRDISERKEAEESLRLSEQNFRDSIEKSPLGIRIVTEDGRTLYVNRALLDICGYSSFEEMKGVPRKQIYTPESYVGHGERVKKRRRGEYVPPSYEISIVRKDGQIRYLTVSRGEVLWNGEQQYQVVYQDVTERKRAEETLRQSEENFRALIENSSDVVIIVDSLGIVKYQSPNYKNVWGRDPVDEIGSDIFKNVHPDDMALIGERFDYILKNPKDTVNLEVRGQHGDGSWRIIDIAARNLLEHPAVRGIVVNLRDITMRKQAEEALRESEERYRILYEDAPVGYLVVGSDGCIQEINKTAAEMFGYRQNEMVGRSIMDLHLDMPMTRVRVQELAEWFRTGEEIWQEEVTMKRKDGSLVLVNLLVRPVRDNEGHVLSARAVFVDITEKKQAEEALRASEARYRLLAENVRDVIWAMDMDLRFTYVSPSVKYLGGRTAEEVMSMSVGQLLAPSSQERAMKVFAEELVMANATPYNPTRSRTMEVEILRRDGSTLWAELRMNFMRDPTGKPVGILGVMRDISERKKAEAERREFEQKAQLASHLASVGELSAGVAHEINNPLTGVIGYAELLMQEDVPTHVKDDLKIIRDGAKRVADIVKGLLTFARQTRPERTVVDINEVVQIALRLRAYELETSNIKVTAKLAPDLPFTIADPGQLQQVFLNLVINAEMEMKLAHGKGKLIIKTEHIDDTIRISFKDDGPGISEENLERIFDPFFTTREAGKGTGLGLSICHGIVAEHGGVIRAESRSGKGATFIIELPIVTEEKHPRRAKPARKTARTTKGKILVVDDEPVVRRLLSQVLAVEGHEVEATDDGNDALDRIKGNRYSLIMLDMKLPGMSGSELYGRIQEVAQSSAQQVVFITGDVMGVDTEAFLARTKLPYIAKPFEVNKLGAEINRLLATTRLKRSQQVKKQKSKARK